MQACKTAISGSKTQFPPFKLYIIFYSTMHTIRTYKLQDDRLRTDGVNINGIGVIGWGHSLGKQMSPKEDQYKTAISGTKTQFPPFKLYTTFFSTMHTIRTYKLQDDRLRIDGVNVNGTGVVCWGHSLGNKRIFVSNDD